MAKYRFVSPETQRIDLDGGDWIEVKQRLTIGELNRATKQAVESGGAAYLAMYLVDWSFADVNGKVVPINGKTYASVLSAVESLSIDEFNAVDEAMGQHLKSVKEADDAAKKDQSGTPSSDTSKTSSPSAA